MVKLVLFYHSAIGVASMLLVFMGVTAVFINTILCVLNLLPLPPLDGGRVLTSLFPLRRTSAVGRVEPLGLEIFLILPLTGALGQILRPILDFIGLSLGFLIRVPRDFFYSILATLLGAG